MLKFRDRFKSLFAEEFQAWVVTLLRALHPNGDFQPIRKTSGDGGIDGFAIGSQRVYAIYAPRRITELKDSETAAKMQADFEAASASLGDSLKEWTFIHNDPAAAIGKETAIKLAKLRSDHSGISIQVLDIDSLWARLRMLPESDLEILFGSATPNETAAHVIQVGAVDEPAAPTTTRPAGIIQKQRRIELRLQTALHTILAEEYGEGRTVESLNKRRFDRARNELVTGSVIAAERDYRTLIDDLLAQHTHEETLLFRSYTNLGSALWAQGKRDDAVNWFEKAAALKPEEPKAKTNLALCFIHREQFQSAIQILTELHKTHPISVESIYLLSQTLIEQGMIEKAVQTLEANRFEQPDYYVALAEAYLRSDLFDKAREAAEKALDTQPENASALTILAWSKGFPFLAMPQSNRMRGPKSQNDREQIRQAMAAAEKAMDILRAKGRLHELSNTLTNYGALNGLIGRADVAESSAREAVKLQPSNKAALRNFWYALISNEKYLEALKIAKEIGNFDAVDGKLRELDTFAAWGEPQRLLSESEKIDPLADKVKESSHWFELRTEAYMAVNEAKKAFDEIELGLAVTKHRGRLLALRGSIRQKLGESDAAVKDIQLAEEISGDDPMVLLYSSRLFDQIGEYSKAKIRLEKLGAQSIYSPLFEQYLITLFHLREFAACQKLTVEAITETVQFNPILYDIAGRSAYYANDLEEARKLFETLLSKTSLRKVETEMALAQVYARLDENEKALTVLNQARLRAPRDSKLLIGLSTVSLTLQKYEDAAKFAARAVDLAPQSLNAHKALFAASLKTPTKAITKKLREKVSKSYAFLQAHPQGGLKAIELDTHLSSLKQLLKEQANRISKLEEFASQRRIPIGMFADAIGRNIFETWLTLRGHNKIPIFFETGLTEEQIKEHRTADENGPVSVDVLTLFTLSLLGHLPLLKHLGSEIVVHSSILECISNAIRELELRGPTIAISMVDDQLVRNEVTGDVVSAWLAFLKSIRDYLRGAQVKLTGFFPSGLSAKDVEVRNALGILNYDPIAIASANNARFYCDDALLRSLALTTYNVRGFGTQAALRVFRCRHLLTETQYHEALLVLLANNYHFVSDEAETLLHLVRIQGHKPTDFSVRLIRRLSQEVNPESGALILATFLSVIWRSDFSASEATRDHWLELAADVIQTAQSGFSFCERFVANLAVLTFLDPEVFGGITGKLITLSSPNFRDRFYRLVQGVIMGAESVVTEQFPEFTELPNRWKAIRRLNKVLRSNSWL